MRLPGPDQELATRWTRSQPPRTGSRRPGCWPSPATTGSCAGSACRRWPAPPPWSWPQSRARAAAGCAPGAARVAEGAGRRAGARPVPGPPGRSPLGPGSRTPDHPGGGPAVCRRRRCSPRATPTPYIIRARRRPPVWATGEADFEELWARSRRARRSTWARTWRRSHYWCEKWHGSREQAEAFAQAARRVRRPSAACCPALPLFAVFEHLPEASTWCRGLYRSEVVERAIEGAQFAVRPGPRATTRCSRTSGTCWCGSWYGPSGTARRWSSCALVDGHVGAVPWSYGRGPRRRSTRLPRAGGGGLGGAGRQPGDAARLTPRAGRGPAGKGAGGKGAASTARAGNGAARARSR